MYEIVNHVSTEVDLTSFLETTRNFGKKSCNCRTGSHLIMKDGSKYPLLQVTAIAISRDVTYILHWTFPYDCHVDQTKYYDSETELDAKAADGKFPIKNAVPHRDEDRKLFYPYLSLEEASRPYEDVFTANNFNWVHTISKDGQPLRH